MALNQYFMKKVFLLAAGLAMILTACQKEESLSDPGGVCTQAITVTIPQELQKIANNSFYWGAAKTVICRATVPPTLSAKIYPSQTEMVLKVPAEAIGDYKTATNWNTGRFKAIEAIE